MSIGVALALPKLVGFVSPGGLNTDYLDTSVIYRYVESSGDESFEDGPDLPREVANFCLLNLHDAVVSVRLQLHFFYAYLRPGVDVTQLLGAICMN